MKRRTFLSTFIFIGGGLAGHSLTRLTGSSSDEKMAPEAFSVATSGVSLKNISSTLQFKLFTRQLTDHDRHAFMAEVVNHNRRLFIVDADSKRHGNPGFYRVTE
jgi:hypothetical protein